MVLSLLSTDIVETKKRKKTVLSLKKKEKRRKKDKSLIKGKNVASKINVEILYLGCMCR